MQNSTNAVNYFPGVCKTPLLHSVQAIISLGGRMQNMQYTQLTNPLLHSTYTISLHAFFFKKTTFISKKAGNAFANSKQKHNFAPQNGGNAYINAAR
ncbi:MAG: hypothetical protein PUC38_02515 [Bacteroidales bacterium]|nr:hypothetical protein [Bacteroidales bacterium]